jgi:uncharacterized membrane protein YraQ (UPF0718 family)
MNKKNKFKKRYIFLLLTIGLYIFIYFWNYILFLESIYIFIDYVIKLLPSLILMWGLLYIFNLFLNPKKLKKYLEESLGMKKYFFIIFLAIISSGPIYAWYPLLGDLKKNGLKDSFIAIFLYARSIKPALLPLMLTYFSFTFVFLLTTLTIIFSLLSGLIIATLFKEKTCLN